MLTKFWHFLKRDPLRRGVALAFSLFLYLHLHTQLTTDERHLTVKVPVTLRLSSGLQQPAERPQIEVMLKTKAGSEVPHDLLAAKIHARVNVTNRNRQADGTYVVRVRPGDVRIPDSRFKVHEIISPAGGVLKLVLLRQDERNAAVQPLFDGAPPSGKELTSETIPGQVLLTGAENVISRLEKVYTAPIPLTDPPDFFEFETPLNLPAQVTALPSKVLVRVRLIRKFSRRSLRLPAAVLGAPGRPVEAAVAAQPEGGVEVILRGPAAKLAALTPDQVRLFVDASEVTVPGRRRLPVRCHVSVPEIESVSIVPDELEVQFTTNTSGIKQQRKEKKP